MGIVFLMYKNLLPETVNHSVHHRSRGWRCRNKWSGCKTKRGSAYIIRPHVTFFLKQVRSCAILSIRAVNPFLKGNELIEKNTGKSKKVDLRKGESEHRNGTFQFRWTDDSGKRHSVYAPTLEELILCTRFAVKIMKGSIAQPRLISSIWKADTELIRT